MLKTEKFILASASPRRKELLTKAGYNFEIVVSNVDESKISADGLTSMEYTCKLAMAKAQDVGDRFPNKIVVGSDTIADFNGEIIGKAESAWHAEEITRKLFSRPHKIITAIAMIKKNADFKTVEYDVTTVYPRKMTDKEIAEHIASGTWEDKAGAYAIQEGGDKFIERIDGSLTNVMGFGMELFEKMFKQAAI
ncbi:MAG: Maf family protein [Planctomycetaceae bacterium]|nr:Maf family protein [Planctomycetaceae bacterium]